METTPQIGNPNAKWEARLRKKHILLTGGAGYIGSHIAVELLESGSTVTIVDSLVNSNIAVIDSIKQITKKEVSFFKADLVDEKALENVFKSSDKFDAVIHLAGFKAVGESVQKPVMYYENNLISSINLLKQMEKYECYTLVFSSSSTVYGECKDVPFTEETPTGPVNPYGQTKFMI